MMYLNFEVTLKTGFVVQGHIYKDCFKAVKSAVYIYGEGHILEIVESFII